MFFLITKHTSARFQAGLFFLQLCMPGICKCLRARSPSVAQSFISETITSFPHSLSLSLCLCLPFSHINRKTQYENPVLEARRKKQVDIQQPPEGERYVRGSFHFSSSLCFIVTVSIVCYNVAHLD